MGNCHSTVLHLRLRSHTSATPPAGHQLSSNATVYQEKTTSCAAYKLRVRHETTPIISLTSMHCLPLPVIHSPGRLDAIISASKI